MNFNHIEVFGMAISSHGNDKNQIQLKDGFVDLSFFVDPVKEWVTEYNRIILVYSEKIKNIFYIIRNEKINVAYP